jgi:hypothetical protein
MTRCLVCIKGSVVDHLLNMSKNKIYWHYIILYTAAMDQWFMTTSGHESEYHVNSVHVKYFDMPTNHYQQMTRGYP